MKVKTKMKSIVALGMMAAFSLGTALSLLGINVTADSTTTTTTANGAITYSTSDFTVTEDYAPFVMAAGKTTAGTDWLDVNGTSKMRLDEGKRGLYLETKKTGDDAEGSTFTVTNELDGYFSMDFRVFSEVSSIIHQNGATSGNTVAWGLSQDDDAFNPYMDIRRVGIRIKSVTNPDVSFVVYVYGGQSWNYATAIARVAIDGETFTENGVPGYGLNHKRASNDWGDVTGGGSDYGTIIYGSSFSNVSNSTEFDQNYSTTIEFDPEAMCVYAVAKQLDNKQYTEKKLLVRDLHGNTIADSGNVKTGTGLATIDKDAGYFDGGYTTEVFIDSMTANDTPLTVASATTDTNAAAYPYASAYPMPLADVEAYASSASALKYANGYDRTGKMVIYSINGQDLKNTAGWTVEENPDNTILALDTEAGKNQVSNAVTGNSWLVDYSTDIKYEDEVGSTAFTAGPKYFGGSEKERDAIYMSIDNPYRNYVGKNTKLVGYIYVKDDGSTVNDGVIEKVDESNNPAYKITLIEKSKNAVVMTGNEWDGTNAGLAKVTAFTQALYPNQWNKIEIDFSTIPESATRWTEAAGSVLYKYQYSSSSFRLSDFGLLINGSWDEESDAQGWSGWEIDANDSFYFSSFKQTQAGADNKNLNSGNVRLISKATGTAAESTAFALNPDTYLKDGTFQMAYTALAARMATSKSVETLHNYTWTAPGLGDNDYEIDPWSDVRELAFTFRSTVDPTQAFTVYTVSRSAYRMALGMRVGVEGESYRNAAGNLGYTANPSHATNGTTATASGTFGMWNNTGSTSYNSYDGTYAKLKIDFGADAIKIYTRNYDNAGDILVRDLSTADVAGLNTLSASNFADGKFTVEVAVTSMNTNWNRGSNTAYYVNADGSYGTIDMGYTRETEEGNYILAEAYERYAIIDIFAVEETAGQTIDKTAVSVSNETGYIVTKEWISLNSLQNVPFTGEAVALQSPILTDLFGGTRNLDGTLSYTADNGDSGEVTFANGVGTFNPTGKGVYTFTYTGEDGYTKTKSIKVADTFTCIIKGESYLEPVMSDEIELSNYVEKAIDLADGTTFIGWLVDGKLYSSDYVIPTSGGATVEAKYITLAMTDGASIRLSTTSPGIRFEAQLSKADYQALQELVGEVTFYYEMEDFDDDHTVQTQEITEFTTVNNYGDTSGETYYLYASIVNIEEADYGKDFLGSVKLTFTAADEKKVTYYATRSLDESKTWRNIREVATNALNSSDEFSTKALEILNKFADLGMQKTLEMNAKTAAHLQNIVVDDEGKYMYGSYGYHIFKVDIATGNSSAVWTWSSSESHGGAIAYHDGYVYMAIIRKIVYGATSKEIQCAPNGYVARIKATDFPEPTETPTWMSADDSKTKIQVAYIGAPITELSSQVYTKDGEEAWNLGGKYGVTSNVDAIAFGPKMGGADDGKTYFTIALATTAKSGCAHTFADGTTVSTATRGDANNIVFGQFDVANIENWGWVTMETYLAESTKTDAEVLAAIPASTYTQAFDNMAFFECGALNYGLQGLTYDKYLNIYMGVAYGGSNNNGIDDTGTEYSDFDSFAIDPRSASEVSAIPGNESETGYVLTAKYGAVGKKNVVGLADYWATSFASVGNGYYYVYYIQGTQENSSHARDVVRLEKFCLTPDTQYSGEFSVVVE